MQNSIRTFGILAFPAEHSLSPLIYQAALAELGIRADFKAFNVSPEKLDLFMEKLKREKISVAVSMPHKEAVISYCTRITNAAKQIGAVNTLYWKDQDLMGHNTDFIGINKPLLQKTDIEGKRVIVLGAGGAAKAAVYACKMFGSASIKVLNRTLDNAIKLANNFNCEYGALSDYDKNKADIIINTTAVGMMSEESLLQVNDFRKDQIVFDCVYRPKMTTMLKNAEKAGAIIITGDNMFIEQACEQFKLFTGKTAPRKLIESVLSEQLKKED